MSTLKGSATDLSDREIVITRLIDAPRELVLEAWTDPERLIQWHAPRGCTLHLAKMDARPGGEFHSSIRSPEGHECWCKGIYREIVVPERLVFTMAVADQEGNLIDPVRAGMDPDWPAETIVTVTLAEHQGKTMLTLHQTVRESLAKRTGAYPSWLEMLDRLGEVLANK